MVADLSLGAPAIAAPEPQPTVASSPDCEGLVEWGEAFLTRLLTAGALTSSFEGIEAEDLDPVALRTVSDQLATLAQETRDSNPPVAATELNTYFADDYFQVLSEATAQIADSLESGDPAGALAAVESAEIAMAAFDPGGEALTLLEQLETDCLNEIDQLNNL